MMNTGRKALNWDETIIEMNKALINPSLFSKERELVLNRFHKYKDTKSSERTFKAIKKLITK